MILLVARFDILIVLRLLRAEDDEYLHEQMLTILIVLRLLRAEDDEYLHEQMLRLNKSESRVVLLYATQYDNLLIIILCVIFIASPQQATPFDHDTLISLKLRQIRRLLWWWSWRSGSTLVSINEVNSCRTRLVLRWVTVSGFSSRCGTLSRYITSHPGQLSLASLRG